MDKLNDQKVINSLAKIRARVITVKFGLTIEIQSCAKVLSHLISLYIAKETWKQVYSNVQTYRVTICKANQSLHNYNKR